MGRNGKDLTEAEEIKKRWQEYTKELCMKDLYDLYNHDDVVTHLQPDNLECEVKWALGNINMSKVNGIDGIPAELFQILKDDSVKVLLSICQKFRKLSSGHKTGKGQFSLQFQRRATPKTVQTTIQLCPFHMLLRLCLISLKLGFNST